MRSTRIIATTQNKSNGVWSYRVVHIGYVLPRTWEPEAVPGWFAFREPEVAPVPAMCCTYRVCTKNLPQKGLQMYIPPPKSRFQPFFEGYVHAYRMQGTFRAHIRYVQAAQRTCLPTHRKQKPPPRQVHTRHVQAAQRSKRHGRQQKQKNCYLCKTHIKQHKI